MCSSGWDPLLPSPRQAPFPEVPVSARLGLKEWVSARPSERRGEGSADDPGTCPGAEPEEGPGATFSRSFSALSRSTSSCGQNRQGRGQGWMDAPGLPPPAPRPQRHLDSPACCASSPGAGPAGGRSSGPPGGCLSASSPSPTARSAARTPPSSRAPPPRPRGKAECGGPGGQGPCRKAGVRPAAPRSAGYRGTERVVGSRCLLLLRGSAVTAQVHLLV